MVFKTLRAARSETGRRTPDPHHYVRLASGGWCRTFGPPGSRDPITGEGRPLRNIRGNTWELTTT